MIPYFKNYGILGINARNFLYIRPYNPKKAIRLADDKLKTKQFLSARGISVPRLFSVIRSREELENFDFSALPSAFVLKPNLGFGGEGIIPVVNRKGDIYVKSSGAFLYPEELNEQIGDILEGRFSISGVSDVAFFEQLIICDERLGKFAYKGLPDIRVVVHNLIPVMAMLRLPTKESDGKANLHQGAVGVGIDIAKGTATHIVHHNKIVQEIPGVGPIRGLKIPYWDEMLLIASKVQMATNLGYLAADIALDRNAGPVLLEINARAGLSVQVANLAPLRKRLERIEGIKVSSPEKGVRIAQDIFGNKVEKDVKKVSGKAVVGHLEKVKLIIEGETRHVWASINPLLERSLIDRELVDDLGLSKMENVESLKIKFSLADSRIQTVARLEDLSGKKFQMVIGRRDLQNFLIDPSKGKRGSRLPPFSAVTVPEYQPSGVNFLDLDKRLISVDRQLKLLYHLKPVNLRSEMEKFLKKPNSNPQFEYPELLFDVFHLREDLKKIDTILDESPLGLLFKGKVSELERKVDLLEAIGTDHFEEKSVKLFGEPTEDLMKDAQLKLDQRPKVFPKAEKKLSMEEAIYEFERVLKHYRLDGWVVKVKKDMVADCLAGKNQALFVREGARFGENRLRMVVAHEIETHVITAENGKHQPYSLFNRGFADYLETQEGLAIWNQEHVLLHDMEKNYKSALLVFIVQFARKHSFAETVAYCQTLGMGLKKAFRSAMRVKRGFEDTKLHGAFTKEISYFSGYRQVRDFVANGGNLKDLYYGKYNLKDLQNVKNLPALKEPFVLPDFLR